MKGKHHHKASGGSAPGSEKDFGSPRDEYKAEENAKPPVYAGREGKVPSEAEEHKRGGKAKRHHRKHGGHIKVHHESGEHMKHAKHLGHVHGHMKHHAGRAPRKSGGKAGSNFSPLSSAHGGEKPRGHSVTEVD